jgi:lambda family phage tail tape measure protein
LLGSVFGGGGAPAAAPAATGLATATATDVAAAGDGLMFLASGGYTGPGGKYEPAGIVHKDEFVLNQDATRSIGPSGRAFLDRLNRRGYADGGFVTGVMSGNLSAPSSKSDAGPSGRSINLTMNVPKGTDTKTAGQWGAAAARQLRMHEARNT